MKKSKCNCENTNDTIEALENAKNADGILLFTKNQADKDGECQIAVLGHCLSDREIGLILYNFMKKHPNIKKALVMVSIDEMGLDVDKANEIASLVWDVAKSVETKREIH